MLAVVDERWSVPPQVHRLSTPSDAGAALALDSSANLAVFEVNRAVNRQLAVDLRTSEQLWRSELRLHGWPELHTWGGGRCSLAFWPDSDGPTSAREGTPRVAILAREGFELVDTSRPRTWKHDEPAALSDDGHVLCASSGRYAMAWDRGGRPLWHIELPWGDWPRTRPWPAGESSFALGYGGGFSIVAEGRIVARHELPWRAHMTVRARLTPSRYLLEARVLDASRPLIVALDESTRPIFLPGEFVELPSGAAGPPLLRDSRGRYAAIGPEGLIARRRRPRAWLGSFPPAGANRWILWADREAGSIIASDPHGRVAWSSKLTTPSLAGIEPIVVGSRHILTHDRTLLTAA